MMKDKKTPCPYIWECFNGLILDGKVIDHINDVKDDNRLCNLQLLTQQENSKKAAKNRDYTQTVENFKNVKCVKSINIETNEVLYFNSMYAVNQRLGIHQSIVRKVCEGVYGCKTGKSKKDGKSCTFEYVKKEDMPDNYIKSANERPKRVSDGVKWQNKEWICPKCGKILKNSNRQYHRKICF